MEKTRTFETLLFVALVFVYNGYQECAAHPEKSTSVAHSANVPDKSTSSAAVDDSKEQAKPDEAALIKSKKIYDALPADLKPYNEQVAGRGLGPDGIGLLYDEHGNVYKANPTDAEVEFFEKLYKSDDPVVQELKEYAPKYFGIRMIQIGDEEQRFLHMENIMKGFEKPCNIDVKIKHIIWDPPVREDKPLRFKEITDTYGFGITGFKYFDVMTAKEVRNKREAIFNMKPHEGIQALYKFVNGEIGIKCGVVAKIVDELDKIASWIARQRHFIINNNSVLLTYDAQKLVDYVKYVKESAKKGETNEACSKFDVPVRVRMVFFGKVEEIKEQDRRDREYLKALNVLIPMMENLSRLNTKSYYDPLVSQIKI